VAGGGALAAGLRDTGLDAADGRGVVDPVRAGNPTAVRMTRQAGRDIYIRTRRVSSGWRAPV
jgi:hypothetical protein